MTTDSSRRNDIDWLRVFAVYMLFVFHTAMVFNPAPFYHIRNHDLSMVALITAGFISLWHMPLFFLLAGWSAHGSLAARGAGGFVRERVLKLWVPLIMGCILLMPPIKYLELRSGLDASVAGLRVSAALQPTFAPLIPSGLPLMPPFDETFLEFLPTFFTELTRFTWAHLWFVAYLLVFTLLYLPAFRWLRARRATLARAPGWWIYLPIVPLALTQIFLRPYWPGLQNLYDDWANVAYYTTYLWCGFLLARFPALEQALHREWRRALAIAAASTIVLLLGVLRVYDAPTLLLAGTAVAGWCFVVALLGAAHQLLASASRGLAYLTEAAFPVYWLHQSAIVLIGYLVIRLELGIAAKFALLLVAAVAATMLIYHFGVRRFAVTRFIVGMKPRSATRTRVRLPQPTAAALLGLALAATALSARAAAAAGPIGVWHAEGGAAQVEIRACGDALCGRVLWLRAPFDEHGCSWHDRANRDPVLQARPIVGLDLLHGLHVSPHDPRLWQGGSIYDPTSGRTYACRLTVLDEDRIELRGYLGIPMLGRTTTWIRVGAEERVCRAASSH